MDRRERAPSQQTAMLAVLAGAQSAIWTALPAIVQSFDATKRTVVAQPTIKAQVQNPDGSKEWVTLPLLLDCPVFFPSGGGVTLTFPIKVGDECLVVFANRCIDAWWQSGGVQIQADFRMHDLSDGFAFVGVASVPKVIPNISTTKAQLRNDAGDVFVELDPTGALTLTANAITINGAVTVNGSLSTTGALVGQGTNVHSHIHSGVVPGGGNSGAPV